MFSVNSCAIFIQTGHRTFLTKKKPLDQNSTCASPLSRLFEPVLPLSTIEKTQEKGSPPAFEQHLQSVPGTEWTAPLSSEVFHVRASGRKLLDIA